LLAFNKPNPIISDSLASRGGMVADITGVFVTNCYC